ncbi:MAG TPA: helix-turn-helix domain-containing protein [Acidiferrobacterales bacterium]
MTSYLHELPSLFALIAKFVLIGYAVRSRIRSPLARLFLFLLVLFSLLNLVELAGINVHARFGLMPITEQFGFAYFAIILITLPAILHVALRLNTDSVRDPHWRPYYAILYLPALPLAWLLLFTDEIIVGFEAFRYSMMRVPGPLYFLLEAFALACLAGAIACLIYGARSSRANAAARTRNRLWLLGLLPLAVMIMYLIVADHIGWPKFTTTFYTPLAITFFLIVTTFAIHSHRVQALLPAVRQGMLVPRLFDPEFFVPGSEVRKRKNAFYAQIRDAIVEIATLKSLQQVVRRLARALQCPVALVTDSDGLAVSFGVRKLAAYPGEELHKVDRMLVADEIADSSPRTYRAMRAHKLAAIVPFRTCGPRPSGWLLLGDPFSRHVHTARDFKLVETLFESLAERLKDDFAALRRQLGDVPADNIALRRRLHELEGEIARLRKENVMLQREHAPRLAGAARDPARTFPKGAIASDAAESTGPTQGLTLARYLSLIEARVIEETLRHCHGNKSEAARLLGLRPNTLHYKLVRYGIAAEDEPA